MRMMHPLQYQNCPSMLHYILQCTIYSFIREKEKVKDTEIMQAISRYIKDFEYTIVAKFKFSDDTQDWQKEWYFESIQDNNDKIAFDFERICTLSKLLQYWEETYMKFDELRAPSNSVSAIRRYLRDKMCQMYPEAYYSAFHANDWEEVVESDV
jgi:hypothetical protein